MILKIEEFKKAEDLVEKIIEDTPIEHIQSEIELATTTFNEKTKRAFYNHISRLFLNVMLNRLEELGNDAKDKSIRARQAIISLINSNQITHV